MGVGALAGVGLAGTAIQGGLGFLGAMQSGSANASLANYQAQVARNNAIIARQNAVRIAQVGAVRAQAQDFRNRAVLGDIYAGQAASGIDTEYGTPATVRSNAADIGRLDTETIYSNALDDARAEQSKAMNYEASAGLYKQTASNASTAGLLSGFSSLIGGATSFGDKWLRYQNAGVPGFGSI